METNSLDPQDVVLIINDDTEFEPDFLEKALSMLQSSEKVLLLACAYGKKSGLLIDAGVRVDWKHFVFEQAEKPDLINCLSTRGLFLRVADFLTIGGFHPRILPHYASDYEFTMRAYRLGFKLQTDQSLCLRVDEEETGYHDFRGLSFRAQMRDYFSKKSSVNPIMWTIFILLACPWQWKLLNICRIWGMSMRHFTRCIFK
ncbi:hypothetical protein GHYDROH2_00990 [Geobacter hydrogenophilus]|uniref:Uncharacterized protein n=1 Tax=Geobacter hydrogenophilus TaxID=40983 RepID=A0A9W6L9K0_9BACT|nr:hypothetical protein GHYDROH2_00990 [Geobacter hydrogenophilus]